MVIKIRRQILAQFSFVPAYRKTKILVPNILHNFTEPDKLEGLDA